MWHYTMPGVFTLVVEEDSRVQVKIEKPELAQYEALQLSDALIQASREVAFYRSFGEHRDSQILSPKSQSR